MAQHFYVRRRKGQHYKNIVIEYGHFRLKITGVSRPNTIATRVKSQHWFILDCGHRCVCLTEICQLDFTCTYHKMAYFIIKWCEMLCCVNEWVYEAKTECVLMCECLWCMWAYCRRGCGTFHHTLTCTMKFTT